MAKVTNAAGGIFVFFDTDGETIIGLQQREDTDEWAATGGIIEEYDDVGMGMNDTIMNCIQRECLEELGTIFDLDEAINNLSGDTPYHYKQKLENHDGYYYTMFITLDNSAYGDFIDGLVFNPSEVADFDFRLLDDWLSEPSLHPKMREILLEH